MDALIKHPDNPKYRRLRYKSPKLQANLGREGLLFLQILGFAIDPITGDLRFTKPENGCRPEAYLPHLRRARACLASNSALTDNRVGKLQLAKDITPEPPVGAAGTVVCHVDIRLPGGSSGNQGTSGMAASTYKLPPRRFSSDQTVADLLRFVATGLRPNGDNPPKGITENGDVDLERASFTVVDRTQHPPRPLQANDTPRTLQTLGLWPSCRLTVVMHGPEEKLTSRPSIRQRHEALGRLPPSQVIRSFEARFVGQQRESEPNVHWRIRGSGACSQSRLLRPNPSTVSKPSTASPTQKYPRDTQPESGMSQIELDERVVKELQEKEWRENGKALLSDAPEHPGICVTGS